MGGVVVEDGVDGLACRNFALDGIQEADGLLMTMALHAAAGDFALKYVESSKQGSRAVAFVVVGHCASPAFLQGQTGLGAVQRLDLGLLVDAEDNGMSGWINIEANDVADLGGKLRVIGELEGANTVRCQAMGTPDALNRGQADARHLGHHPSSPMGRLAGRFAQGQGHNPLDHFVGQPWGSAKAGSCHAADRRRPPP